jgi:hypothetical protein
MAGHQIFGLFRARLGSFDVAYPSFDQYMTCLIIMWISRENYDWYGDLQYWRFKFSTIHWTGSDAALYAQKTVFQRPHDKSAMDRRRVQPPPAWYGILRCWSPLIGVQSKASVERHPNLCAVNARNLWRSDTHAGTHSSIAMIVNKHSDDACTYARWATVACSMQLLFSFPSQPKSNAVDWPFYWWRCDCQNEGVAERRDENANIQTILP